MPIALPKVHAVRHLLALLCAAMLLLLSLPSQAQVRAALTRDMDSAIRGTRMSLVIPYNFDSGQFLATETLAPTIPAGKRLYLQSISTHTLLTDGASIMDMRLSINPGSAARFWVSQLFQASGSTQRHFTGNQELGVLLAAGETIELRIFRNESAGGASTNFGEARIHGYLVDATP